VAPADNQSRGEQALLPPEWEKEEVFEMYKSKSDLPSTLREYLPEDLQEIYLEAYQRSWKGYEEFRGGEAGKEAVAHRDAMMAVQHDHVYHEETGKWYRKGEEPEEEEEQGLLETLKERVKNL
jgi:cation transport regulator ChaB